VQENVRGRLRLSVSLRFLPQKQRIEGTTRVEMIPEFELLCIVKLLSLRIRERG
jgi:hypothetical protein